MTRQDLNNLGRELLVRTFWEIKISQDMTIRFGFPFVQNHSLIHRLTFCKRKLPENSLDKTLARSKFGRLGEKK